MSALLAVNVLTACSEPGDPVATGIVAEVEVTTYKGYTNYYFRLEGDSARYLADAAQAALNLTPGASVSFNWQQGQGEVVRRVTSVISVVSQSPTGPPPYMSSAPRF